MEVTIDENGTLLITATRPLEAYALSKWVDENRNLNTSKILFCWEVKSSNKDNG